MVLRVDRHARHAQGGAQRPAAGDDDGLPGVLYIAQDAPFLGIVQIVVYTGAIMMLFLFVLMLVGVDASDSLVETLRGQRVGAVCSGSASPCSWSPASAGLPSTPTRASPGPTRTATSKRSPRCCSPATSSRSRSRARC
jgi:hypothetical protein